MAKDPASSRPLRHVGVIAATASLVVGALLVSRATAHHQPRLGSRTTLSTTDAQPSMFVDSDGLIPDSPPSEASRRRAWEAPPMRDERRPSAIGKAI
jgi:hypothetical protein